MDSEKYGRVMLEKEDEFESLCKRCGECCGASDDPCRNLVKLRDGSYFCRDYDSRFGRQLTVSGKSFRCVPIREHVTYGTLRPGCGYGTIGET